MAATNHKGLRFPCECVSGLLSGYTDPWADVTKRKLLPNGTKEQILNLIADEPKTISQLAQALNLSAPSVYTHINDMLESELLRESEEFEKKHPSERYYEPNFPVFKAEECAEFHALCDEMADQLATLFERRRAKMERAFRNTNLPDHGWELSDITQCLYANMYRKARTMLEQRGLLTPRVKHANGAEWIFWAEERDD
ncbi:MAG TPA: winged helix-turn-helix domain-containing protein [Pyrinomonadaceae bacterium]|jgi:DNA-binding transcriptional ArsR family regulator|nr:winged helix-turn-helix domain-containing protein [Pyrinomonadaceae bacterium]